MRKGVQLGSIPIEGAVWSRWVRAPAIADGIDQLKPGGPPAVFQLTVKGLFPANWGTSVDTSAVNLQAELSGPGGRSWTLRGSLFGPALGFLVWKDRAGAPRAGTMADYNRRYWAALGQETEAHKPKSFIIADRFIGGDDDYLNWRAGLGALSRAGMNTVLVPPQRALRQALIDAGIGRAAWAVYAPEGKQQYIQLGDPASLRTWAEHQAASYSQAGFDAHDMGIFALADEPGWYYPSMLDRVDGDRDALDRFRRYLQDQGLSLTDIGASSWAEVMPTGRSTARDLASRRLYYWSMRFVSADSSRYFARATQALEEAFYPSLPVFVNWNNFSGRLYVPGAVANNPDKSSPDSAMGLHDWFEFGRERGATVLWTEDWFGDKSARQWSFYAAKLRGAVTEQHSVGSAEQFGGYVVPRAEGKDPRPDGLAQKVMALVGNGAKAVQYYWFGPEYNFPGNCYSEITGALARVRRANEMIAAAEDLLWPGRPLLAPVAILMPRSSELWDAEGQPFPRGIQDATNDHMNNQTVDYMAEVADLYAGLQDTDIPVQFISEDDLTASGLKPYRVLYVTEPDVPLEGQRAVAAWTAAGGTLATVSGAATHDRYDEEATALGAAVGVPRPRAIVDSIGRVGLSPATSAAGAFQAVEADAGVTEPTGTSADVSAKFPDGSPAVATTTVELGEIIHFYWMPGLSYARLLAHAPPGSAGSLDAARNWITFPVRSAHVQPPATASAAGVETPVLLSPKGAAVTLLNWRGAPLRSLELTLRLPFKAARVESVTRGHVPFMPVPGGITVKIPLDAVDVLMIRP